MRRYSIIAVCRDGKESEIAQVDSHPGAIAKAARQKYLLGGSPYTKIYTRDNRRARRNAVSAP
jgi:hypothetical protein